MERDVLAHRTECVVDHGSASDVEGGGVAEHYDGRVWVDTETFAQGRESSADFTVRWPEGHGPVPVGVVRDVRSRGL